MNRMEDIACDVALQKFLLCYRSTPHSMTKVAPSELLCGRRLRVIVDQMIPSLDTQALMYQGRVCPNVAMPTAFTVGDRVSFSEKHPNGKDLQRQGLVTEYAPPYSLIIECDGEIIYRHADDVRKLPSH